MNVVRGSELVRQRRGSGRGEGETLPYIAGQLWTTVIEAARHGAPAFIYSPSPISYSSSTSTSTAMPSKLGRKYSFFPFRRPHTASAAISSPLYKT